MRAARTMLRGRAAGQRGYSLVEMLIVLTIMGTVMASLTTLFVTGTNSELDLNNRFQAQNSARLALDKLRREVHCASSIAPTGAASSITLNLPSQCKTGTGSVTWCTVANGTNRYGLWRYAGASCSGTGVRYADFLTAASVFSYTAPSPTSLGSLHVDFPVNPQPAQTVDTYRLADDVVLRNTTRA